MSRHPLRLDRYPAARLEAKKIHAPERGGVLVLLANRLLEDVDLDVTRPLRRVVRGHTFAAECMQRVEQADGEVLDPPSPVEAGMSPTAQT